MDVIWPDIGWGWGVSRVCVCGPRMGGGGMPWNGEHTWETTVATKVLQMTAHGAIVHGLVVVIGHGPAHACPLLALKDGVVSLGWDHTEDMDNAGCNAGLEHVLGGVNTLPDTI